MSGEPAARVHDAAWSGGRPLVTSLDGMVASAHPLATQAGVGVLHDGGTAFDAAVAVAAALNVVEPFMSGLAGMGFATMWVAAERRVRVLDFVTAVPRSFPSERFRTREQLAGGRFRWARRAICRGGAGFGRRMGG